MPMFTVYVLYSDNHDILYIGYSSDVESRLVSHNQLATKGFTIRYRPWRLIHTEAFETKAEAIQREKALKSGKGREWIRANFI
ncbi:hypothetical protein BH09BAC1_BH09BAC1_01900 [soil metagenome]